MTENKSDSNKSFISMANKENRQQSQIIHTLEPPGLYSTFGKNVNASFKSSPNIIFNKASKKQSEKAFNTKKELKMIKGTNEGPGIAYYPKYENIYRRPKAHRFSSLSRLQNIPLKYQYQNICDINYNPAIAQTKLQSCEPNVKIGLSNPQSKMPVFSPPVILPEIQKNQISKRTNVIPAKGDATPGYYLDSTLNYSNSQYTQPSGVVFDKAKRNQALKTIGSTPANIGPNRYYPDYNKNSNHYSSPAQSIGKSRSSCINTKVLNHETYFEYSAIGKQINSKNENKARVTIGRGKREDFVGLSKPKILKMSLPHAIY